LLGVTPLRKSPWPLAIQIRHPLRRFPSARPSVRVRAPVTRVRRPVATERRSEALEEEAGAEDGVAALKVMINLSRKVEGQARKSVPLGRRMRGESALRTKTPAAVQVSVVRDVVVAGVVALMLTGKTEAVAAVVPVAAVAVEAAVAAVAAVAVVAEMVAARR